MYTQDDKSAFDDIMDNHKSTLRINYYPRRLATDKVSPIDGEYLACPEHYDSGLLTILSQDSVGGLQGKCRHRTRYESKYIIVIIL